MFQRIPSTRSSRSARRVWFKPLTAAVAVLIVLIGPVGAACGPSDPRQPDASHTAVTTVPVPLRDRPDPVLAGLVTAVTNSKTDEADGAYAYIYTQRWHADVTASHADPNEVTVIPMRQQVWRAADGSGRQHTCRLPAVPAAQVPVLIASVDFSAATCREQTHLRGGLAVAIGEPSGDPDQLLLQIQAQEPESGAAGVLRAIAAVAEGVYLDRLHRAAMLIVLSRVAGLTVIEHQKDPLGRDAVTVRTTTSLAGARTEDALLLDPGTGRLLAYQLTTTTAQGRTIPELVLWVATARVPDANTTTVPVALGGRVR